MRLITKPVEYQDGDQSCVGIMAWDESVADARPCVLVSPAWGGLDQFAQDKAIEMAAMGYVGFALDVYGNGATPQTVDEKMSHMGPLKEDRAKLLTRLKAGYKAAAKMEEVDPKAMAMMGFCFGGLCTLDMVRAGVDLQAAISFHGVLDSHSLPTKKSKADVLVCHGWDDPMAKPDTVVALMDELTKIGANAQLLAFTGTTHAFMVPEADDKKLGLKYNEHSANLAWSQCLELLDSKFRYHGTDAA